jgi:hypothetical protein
MIYLRYLRTVLRHKKFVMVECWRAGIPMRGLFHDMSKFRPDEFLPYARYYERDKKRYKKDFKSAWGLHKERNPHHWEYWVESSKESAEQARPMDEVSRLEMLCDLIAAGKSYKGSSARDYYLEERDEGKIILHSETRDWLEKELGV